MQKYTKTNRLTNAAANMFIHSCILNLKHVTICFVAAINASNLEVLTYTHTNAFGNNAAFVAPVSEYLFVYDSCIRFYTV